MKNSILALIVCLVVALFVAIFYIKDLHNKLEREKYKNRNENYNRSEDYEHRIKIFPFVDIKTVDYFEKGFRDGSYGFMMNPKYCENDDYVRGFREGRRHMVEFYKSRL